LCAIQWLKAEDASPMVDPLAYAEVFAGLAAEQRRSVAAIAVERDAAAGEVLFRMGDLADALYVIRSGRVDLTFPLVVMGQVKETRFQSLEPGRTLAWSALVPPHRLTMSARAATHTQLIGFHRERLERLFDAEPELARVVMSNVARVVATRLHELLALWVREVQRNVSQTYR
jgi:CRP-like cAMP-binding protein